MGERRAGESPYELVLEVVFVGELVLGVCHWKFYAGDWVFVLDFYAEDFDQLLLLGLALDLEGFLGRLLEREFVVLFFGVESGLFFEEVTRFGLDDVLVALEGDLVVEGFGDREDKVV